MTVCFQGLGMRCRGVVGSRWATLVLGSEVCSNEQGFPAPMPTPSPALPLDVVFALSCPTWHLPSPTVVSGSLGGITWWKGDGLWAWGTHLILTLALLCSEAAVTVETASAPGAAPSRCLSPPWGPQVSDAGGRGSGCW